MELKLYKNFPINDYSNQVYYDNESERNNEFDKFEDISLKNLSSCDKTRQEIRLNINYYVGNQYNYGCIIENNKRYFIFIDGIQWKSNLNTVILHYSYDYWQTYCYSIKFQNSYVEREHVIDDTFGKHIIDEGLPVDELKVKSSVVLDGGNDGMYFCISTSDTSVISASSNGYVNIGDTCKPSKYEQSIAIILSTELDKINTIIRLMVSNNKIDAISGLYSIPKSSINEKVLKTGYTIDTAEPINYIGVNNDLPIMHNWLINKPKDIDGYVPINNKCFSYPYCFVNITNNNGSSLTGQFELSNDKNSVSFNYYFPMIEGNTSFGYLNEYDGVSKNFDKSIQGQTNIELPYITNTFSAYMSANQNSIANQYDTIKRNELMSNVKTGISVASGLTSSVLTGNVLGGVNTVVNGAMSVAETELNTYNQRKSIDSSLKDQSSRANVNHGAYTGVGSIICGQIGFKGQLMNVTSENIKMIDDYFTMFGYKVNVIKTPQFNSRNYWNYIKTSGVNLIGNVPQDALLIIKHIFDNGVTMWHKLDYMYKYDEYKKLNV